MLTQFDVEDFHVTCKRSQKRLRTYKIEPTLPELAKIRKIRRMFSAIHGDASSYLLKFNAALPHALVRCICFLSKVDAPFPAWADSTQPSTIEVFFTVHSFHGATVGPRLFVLGCTSRASVERKRIGGKMVERKCDV